MSLTSLLINQCLTDGCQDTNSTLAGVLFEQIQLWDLYKNRDDCMFAPGG